MISNMHTSPCIQHYDPLLSMYELVCDGARTENNGLFQSASSQRDSSWWLVTDLWFDIFCQHR